MTSKTIENGAFLIKKRSKIDEKGTKSIVFQPFPIERDPISRFDPASSTRYHFRAATVSSRPGEMESSP